MADISADMAALAERCADEHELDFTLDSLKTLEAIVARCHVDIETTLLWGAYLGETIRRQRPDVVSWIDYEAAGEAVRDVPFAPDLSAVLRIADRVWFPLSKVEKFQTNGSVDSFAAFALVALAFAPVTDSPEQAAREREWRAKSDAELDAVARELMPGLSPDGVCRLNRVFFGSTTRDLYATALRRIGLTVDHLMPLLGEASRGRGWNRLHPGRDAAEFIAMLVVTGVAPREATLARLREQLAAKAKPLRTYAAFALAYSELQSGRTDVVLELLRERDSAAVEGTWLAVKFLSGLVRNENFDHDPAPMMRALASSVCAALTETSSHATAVLEALSAWAFQSSRCADLAPLIPALVAIRDGKHAKRVVQVLERLEGAGFVKAD